MPTIPNKGKKSQPAPKPAPKAPEQPQQDDRKIMYDKREVKIREGEKALTVKMAKLLLGWETEEEYTARLTSSDPSINPEAAKFGDDFLLKDLDKKKVKCSHNSKNRPFTESWARAIAQDILNRNWQFNMENIIVSKYGTILSGQHRLIGLILAGQLWEKKAHWKKFWETEPTIETCIAVGAEETPEVLQTLDNTKPRMLSDNIFTSPLFSDLNNVDRLLCSKMLDSATRLLWKRTWADKNPVTHNPYKTTPTLMDFINHHPRLLDCVKHIFEENKDRQLTTLKLQPGYCAGMMYLMSCSSSDVDVYRNADPSPSEKVLEFDNWDRAEKFWRLLGNPKVKDLQNVRHALGQILSEEGDGGLGSLSEKSAILCKAWVVFSEGQNPTAADVALRYDTDTDGSKTFLDKDTTLGGIDLGEVKEKAADEGDVPEELTEEEKEKRAAEEKKRRAAELKEKVEKARREREEAKRVKNGEAPASNDVPRLTVNGPVQVSRPMTRKEIEAENTRKAAEADAKSAGDKAASEKPPVKKPAAKKQTAAKG